MMYIRFTNYQIHSEKDINLAGELKKAILKAKTSLNNFSFSDVKKSLIITNEKWQDGKWVVIEAKEIPVEST